MLTMSYYFDERTKEYIRIDYRYLKGLEHKDYAQYLYIKERLYRSANKSTPMVLVRNGAHQGFRRKGNNAGSEAPSRGEKESLSHQGNKEAISEIRKLTIKFNNKQVLLFIKSSCIEKGVVCNGSRYEVDILFELEKTEPECYFHDWNGELWFEVFHTCKVDSKQAEDFSIEKKALFEYKIEEDCCFF